jgi:chromatin segregation and condensation protein Rec8/ScpA/Scc1 (kleisin family)
MKADILNPHDPEPYTELAESFKYMFGEAIPEFPSLIGSVDFDLELRPNRVPRRRITAVELIEAIQKVLEEKGAKKSRLLSVEGANGKTTLVIPPDIDITALIEETYGRVVSLLGEKEIVLFSELAKTRTETISVLMSLLHLWNSNRLHLRQERIYEEIYIRNTPFAD